MTVSTDNDQQEIKKRKVVKEKAPKKKGPIRWSAVLPLVVISGGLFVYGKYALDGHLRKAIIWGAEAVHGAEVNLRNLNLSFLKGDLVLKGLQVTDKDDPTKNLVSIDNITFHLNTYELLKAKFIVETSEVTGIQWGSSRKSPGKIYPAKNSAKSEALAKMEEATLKAAQENFQGNALGNVANVLAGNSAKSEIKDIKSELKTEQKIKELEKELKEKEEFYKNKVADLKSLKEFNQVKDSVKAYKWNKKDPIGSLKKLNALIKTTKATAKKYEEDINAIKRDVKKIENVSNNVDKWIEEDMANLQSKVGLPELDPEKLAFSLFGNYFGSNVAKFRKYSEVAKEYMPPPKEQRKANTLVAPPRGEGKTYNFPIKGENPKVWIKRIKVSSQAGDSEFGGDIKGEITDITTSPQIIDRPVAIKLAGNFPKQKLFDLTFEGILDHRTPSPTQEVNLHIGRFPFKGRSLSKSDDLNLKLNPATAGVTFKGVKNGELADVALDARILTPSFEVDAKKKLVKEIVSNSLSNMQALTLKGNASGPWEKLKWKFNSNIGRQLANGFKKELGLRVEKAKADLKRKLLAKIGPQKEKYRQQVDKVKNDLNQTLDQQKGKLKGELKNLLADLKGQQQDPIKKNTKQIEQKAKKLFKKLF
jgi:uncharacterized protein (TIGR03545 family)